VSRWPASATELVREQRALSQAIPPLWRPRPSLRLGGCFVCFARGISGRGSTDDAGWAAAAVIREGRLLESAVAGAVAGTPYDAGLLALREGPMLEQAVRALSGLPQALLVNATGRDHPRRAGLALHLGAVLDLPTVGVTHRPLLAEGTWPKDERGATSPLVLETEEVARWLRTRRGRRPLAVHAAWRTDCEFAVQVVLAVTQAARTPEPLRQARRVAREARAGATIV
jgi:deoxyribonuclease V